MELLTDHLSRILYSTDASAYRELPFGVCYPENEQDIIDLIHTARSLHTSIIPRAAGTSIAGQVVGGGIVADISKHMNRILEVNVEKRWARIGPGVVRDELNMAVAQYGLFFSPETSTSNRCCLGGMVGNNSCGSHSLSYGSTRDHLIEVKAVLSDGTKAVFSKRRAEEVIAYLMEHRETIDIDDLSLEERIYGQLLGFSEESALMEKIRREFPDPSLRRRNCGYALDLVLEDFDLCKIFSGSEGTLAFAYELTVTLDPLPPKKTVLVCAHCDDISKVFQTNLLALKHHPSAIEMIDHNILELSKKNPVQNRNRFFVSGEPAGILITELNADTQIELDKMADALEKELMESGLVYHCSFVYGKDIPRVWELRRAGLGLLSGMKGDLKPVPVIEDTAIPPEGYAAFYADFRKMLDTLGLSCVYYGHIGTGELHLRPILNLKDSHDREQFHTVALETARLVKKYNGSLSGEHGDGRLRGEFIPMMYGEEIYQKLCEVKSCWDPDGIFNPGKITGTPPMNEFLRFDAEQQYPPIQTYFDFSDDKGMFCAIELCNGSADCRRSSKFPGTICPSYRAGKEERFSTRARANVLRELLTHPANPSQPFDSPEIHQILELCLSCKGCKGECPSNVDMTRLKAEFLQHWYDIHGTPLRTKMVAHVSTFMHLGSMVPGIYNYFASAEWSSRLLKKMIDFAPERKIPLLGTRCGKKFIRDVNHHSHQMPAHLPTSSGIGNVSATGSHHLSLAEPAEATTRQVYLFADEFTMHQDTIVGRDFVTLLNRLGYTVTVPKHFESGRAAISKGLVLQAKELAIKNVSILKDIISSDCPLVGLEPSTILSFRDEYPALVPQEMKKAAYGLARNCLLYDEFIMREAEAGRITKEMFSDVKAEIYLHGHCHQKAIVGTKASQQMLSLPSGYNVHIIPSGCCGMAGSFGYEKEHYEFSMSVGEETLFPAIRKATNGSNKASGYYGACGVSGVSGVSGIESNGVSGVLVPVIVCAPGTSCRQQILDGTGITAIHPIQALLAAISSCGDREDVKKP